MESPKVMIDLSEADERTEQSLSRFTLNYHNPGDKDFSSVPQFNRRRRDK